MTRIGEFPELDKTYTPVVIALQQILRLLEVPEYGLFTWKEQLLSAREKLLVELQKE
jgi:hypothetical protein